MLQLVDARAQFAEIALARRRVREERRRIEYYGEHQRSRPDQTFALPCADTAAIRRSISAASPR
jgi:hypothetical protein